MRAVTVLTMIASSVAGLVALWMLLVPVTVAYETSSALPAPRSVATLYSWWTPEQDVIYTDAQGVDLTRLSLVNIDQTRLIEAYRLNCGDSFTTGPHEELVKPDGPAMCAKVENSRRIIGLSILGLAVVLLAVLVRLRGRAARSVNRYRQPHRQRRLLRRGGR